MTQKATEFEALAAGRLEPSRAVAVAGKLSTDFLADVAVELDPRRTSAVIAGIPARRIGAITAELVRRAEYVTMGQFVGHLGDEALRAALDEMSDADVLRVGFVLEDKGGLDRLVGPPESRAPAPDRQERHIPRGNGPRPHRGHRRRARAVGGGGAHRGRRSRARGQARRGSHLSPLSVNGALAPGDGVRPLDRGRRSDGGKQGVDQRLPGHPGPRPW
jgi:hypothetical protein